MCLCRHLKQQTQLHRHNFTISPRHPRELFQKTFRPSKEEGAGKTGCTLHPRSRAQRHTRKRARAYRFSGGNPAFPAQWFYDLFRALPGDRLSCHRRLRIAASLTPASGCQDHTTSPYATARSSRTLPRPSQPGPTFMTTAKRPSCGPGWRKLVALICPTSIEEYFRSRALTGFC